jgi:hypothetical protein
MEKSAKHGPRRAEASGKVTGVDRVQAMMTVISVGRRQGTIDLDPVYEVDLLLSRPGRSAQSVATSLRVPLNAADRFVAGSQMPVELSSSDSSVFDIDWSFLA